MNKKQVAEFEELAHAFFEPGDKDYWDAIEFAKEFIEKAHQEGYEEAVEEIETKFREILDDKFGLFSSEYKAGVEFLSYLTTLTKNNTQEE